MRLLLKEFFKDKMSFKQSNGDFDYEFKNHSSDELFYVEFDKFLGFYNGVFYHDNRLVTIFNSNEIRIKLCDLEAIFNLYLYAESNSLSYYKNLLQDFLYTYQITINTNEYRENYEHYQVVKDEFSSIVDSLKIRRKFFVDIPNDLYLFYKELINFGLEKDIFIDSEVISRIFNNLDFANVDYNELIDLFIQAKKNIYGIVIFDKEKNKHLDIYLEYIMDSLEHFGGYNYAKEIIFELDKAKVLDNTIIKKILNKYVKVVNELVKKLKEKDFSFIKGLSEIDSLKKELLYLLNNIQSLVDEQKVKVKECLARLLQLKRFILSDDAYVRSEMHESKFEQKIPSEEVEKYRKALFGNKFALYSASKVNFVSEVGQSLEMYADYPLHSLVSRFTIDSKRGTYSVCIEDNQKFSNDKFKEYFDRLGFEYTECHPDLQNKLTSNYYEELLKYLSSTFNLHQRLLLSMISKDEFYNLIEELKSSIGYNFENRYAMIVSNVLAIEVNVIKLLEKNNIETSTSGFTNLNNLFEICKNDEEKVNGLMYLNYILYEKSGVNLRNNVMHGTLINEDLTIELLVSFAGLIFISWLLNEK